MERLTKTYSDGTHGSSDSLPCGENSYDYKNLLIEKLGKYEDLEEQGLLLRLPAEAYFIKDNIVRKGWVQELVYSLCSKLLLDIRYDDSSLDSYRGYLGNDVFLTQAEAEQKLKEMECD